MLHGPELHVHTDQKILELHYVEGPRNVIADIFSRLLRSNMSSPLVGKKAANFVSNSESSNRNKSSHSLLMDDRDIIDCLMNLPCLYSRKKKKKVTNKMQKMFQNDIKWEQILVVIPFYDFTVEQCYLNLPEDMVEYNPFRSGEPQRHKTMMRNSCSLQLSFQSGTVTSLSMILKTSCVILNQVIVQPTGKLNYLRTW